MATLDVRYEEREDEDVGDWGGAYSVFNAHNPFAKKAAEVVESDRGPGERYDPLVASTPVPPAGPEPFAHQLPLPLQPNYFLDLLAAEPQRPNGEGSEVQETTDDFFAALRHLHNLQLYNRALFATNERCQVLKDMPLKEMVQGGIFSEAWRLANEDVMAHFAKDALNAQFLVEGIGKKRYVLLGKSSVLDMLEGSVIHRWRSSVEAKQFVDGWRRVWHACFEYKIDGVTAPMSCAYDVQGTVITVTSLAPIEATFTPMEVTVGTDPLHEFQDDKTYAYRDETQGGIENHASLPLSALMRRYCHALGIARPSPLYRGLDGRFYVMTLDEVLYPNSFTNATTAASGFVQQLPRHELLMAMRDMRSYAEAEAPQDKDAAEDETREVVNYGEFFEDEYGIRRLVTPAVLDNPMEFMRVVSLRRVVFDLLRDIALLELQGTVTDEELLDLNIVSQVCHRHGVNLCFLPMLLPVLRTVAMPASVEELREAHGITVESLIKAEMAIRAIKHMVRLDLNLGAGSQYSLNETAERVQVINRVAQMVASHDDVFWHEHVQPFIRAKFHNMADDLVIEQTVASPNRLLRGFVEGIGCELADGQYFTHFCHVARTRMMGLRPPALVQLYIERRYVELELEVPRLWKQWRHTPVHSPLRHSLFMHLATVTMMSKASDLYYLPVQAAEECVVDYATHPFLALEVLGLLGEMHRVLNHGNQDLMRYAATLMQMTSNEKNPLARDTNTPVVGIKVLNAGLLTRDLFLISDAARLMLRARRTQPVVFSETYEFALSCCSRLVLKAPAVEPLLNYFSLLEEHARIVRPFGMRAVLRAYIEGTSLTILAERGSLLYHSEKALSFAQHSMRHHLDSLGTLHRCTCFTAFHLAVIAARNANPPVEKYLPPLHDALRQLRDMEKDEVVAATRHERGLELLRRVAEHLGRSNDAKSRELLFEFAEGIVDGVGPRADDETAVQGQPEFIAGSIRSNASLAAKPTVNLSLSFSGHFTGRSRILSPTMREEREARQRALSFSELGSPLRSEHGSFVGSADGGLRPDFGHSIADIQLPTAIQAKRVDSMLPATGLTGGVTALEEHLGSIPVVAEVDVPSPGDDDDDVEMGAVAHEEDGEVEAQEQAPAAYSSLRITSPSHRAAAALKPFDRDDDLDEEFN